MLLKKGFFQIGQASAIFMNQSRNNLSLRELIEKSVDHI